jgi:hypothetical protein
MVWFWIEAFLSVAANISKALWGPGGKKAEEREPLRRSLGVPDSAPLEITDMRNHFEHFDDRLESWWAPSPSHNYFDRNIMPRSVIKASHLIDEDFFRFLDPVTGDVIFWGDAYNLPAIAREIHRILSIAAARPWTCSKP